MGLQTYQAKINGRTIGIKARKAEAQAIAREFDKVVKLNQYVKELYGIIGQNENTSILYSPFMQTGEPQNKEEYQASLTSLVNRLPDTLTLDNAKPFIAEARDIFNKHIPVADKRRTQADEIVRQAEVTVIKAQQEADRDEWRQRYCQDKPIAIPQGMMATYLELTFDDSHSMTDYFEPHRQIGNDMLLAIVNKQPERESLARRILANYPELNKLAWSWHTENYSMGHGNYLLSEWQGEESHQAYDGRDKVSTRYEIRFNSYTREMLPYRDYPGTTTQTELQPIETTSTAVIAHNETLNGIEVKFPSKPSQSILDNLKTLGFRWSKYNSLWYARYTEDLFNKVKAMLNAS